MRERRNGGSETVAAPALPSANVSATYALDWKNVAVRVPVAPDAATASVATIRLANGLAHTAACAVIEPGTVYGSDDQEENTENGDQQHTSSRSAPSVVTEAATCDVVPVVENCDWLASEVTAAEMRSTAPKMSLPLNVGNVTSFAPDEATATV